VIKTPDTDSPTEEPLLYNSKIISNYLELIRRRYAYIDIADLLNYARMESYQVADEGHWFSQGQVDLFHEYLTKATGVTSIAREAGQYSASPEGLGWMSRYVLGLAGPAKAFEAIGKLAGRLTRSSSFESVRISDNEIELTVRPREGVSEKPYQCENRIGYFEAIIAGFNGRNAHVEHPECVFRGDQACTYHITWSASRAAVFRIARLVFSSLAVVALVCIHFVLGLHIMLISALIATVVVLFLSLLKENYLKLELDSAIANLRSTTERGFEDFERVYRNALMGREIGHALSASKDMGGTLRQVMRIFSEHGDYDRGMILIADERELEFRAGFGYSDELYKELRGARFSLYKPESRGIFVQCYREHKPFLINDIESIEKRLSAHSLDLLRKMGSKSFVCCPILYEDQCLGVLAVDNFKSKRPLLESDLNLLMSIAPEIGITLNSAMFVEEREEQFRSILRTLAASIDARDALTAGHSERVTEYAVAICKEMNLSMELTEVIRVAAQLHDYGKIGIKDSILKKSGPLTGKEREEIKTHAVKTQDILSRINFAGAYQQVPFIAGSHHERLDGTGYPRGLKGSEIPLGARILAVADFFEAISAKRHYHEPQPLEAAIEMLRGEADHHLDAIVIQALIRSVRRSQNDTSVDAVLIGQTLN